MARKSKTELARLMEMVDSDAVQKPLNMAEGLAMQAISQGIDPEEVGGTFGLSKVADAKKKLHAVGRITRPLLNQMLLDAYDESRTAMEKVASVRELGKMNGLYAPEKQISVTAKASMEELARLTDDELRRIAMGEEVLDGEFEEIPNE